MSVIKNNQTFANGLTLEGAVVLGSAASFDGGANVLGNVADPVANQDVVTKAYGDANYGGSEPSDTVQTTDATPTTISTIAIASDSAVNISAFVSGASADFSDVTGGSVQATVRNDSGTLTIVGTSLPIVNASTTGTFDITVSGTNALVQVTGLAATTYNWTDRYFTVVQA